MKLNFKIDEVKNGAIVSALEAKEYLELDSRFKNVEVALHSVLQVDDSYAAWLIVDIELTTSRKILSLFYPSYCLDLKKRIRHILHLAVKEEVSFKVNFLL